ncbi:MAG: AAA family ATPase [Eubacteriaceae bacterium]|nr:AAA family ATPase [Eubacteriaceae bacterium]
MIKKLIIHQFSGLMNKEITFEEGLNIIVGPNEVGKSTVVDAIFSVLFRSTDLKKSNSRDKDFLKRALPYPSGDTASVEIEFAYDGKKYNLHKIWGSTSSGTILKEDDQIITDKIRVSVLLARYLRYGEGTYANIIFAKQDEFKHIFESIKNEHETNETINSIFQKAVFEMDGISLKKLQDRINNEFIRLSGKWDIGNNRPENNRGINNPYLKGFGEILESYYQKESFLRDIKILAGSEAELDKEMTILNSLRKELDISQQKLTMYETVEEDIIKRDNITLQISALNSIIMELGELNRSWPAVEERYKNKMAEAEQLSREETGLVLKLEKSRLAEKIEKDKELVFRIEELKTEISMDEKEILALTAYTRENISNLRRMKANIVQLKTILESAILKGKLNLSAEAAELTDAYGNKRQLAAGENFETKAYFRITLKNQFDMEIQSGNIDYDQTMAELSREESEYHGLLEMMDSESFEQALINEDKLSRVTEKIKLTRGNLEKMMKDKNLQEIKENIIKFGEFKPEDIGDLEKRLDFFRTRKNEILTEIGVCSNDLMKWKEKYISHDKIFDRLIDTKAELNELEKKLSTLAALPVGFESSDDFRRVLNRLKTVNKEDAIKEIACERRIDDLKRNMPDTSIEELEQLYDAANKKFERLIVKLRQVQKIRETLARIVENLKNETINPLVKSIQENLSAITENKYVNVLLDEELNVCISGNKGKMLPSEFLSSGTLDSISLAFRLAVIEHLGGEAGMLTVMDDCLVNLDHERQKNAALLLRKHSLKNQVIYTTFSPDIGALLGGKIISIV